MRVCGISVNGGLTGRSLWAASSNEVAKTHEGSEYNRNNSWNLNFNDGNVNNNNKYNSNCVRPCTASAEYQKILSSVWEAYDVCLVGKRSSPQALEYMPEAGEDIPRLAWELYTMTYEPSLSTCFMVLFPKLREVFAAAFRDRIIHHWACMRLLPLFEERCHELGDVSHACRKGYGTKTAVKQVQDGMIRVSDHLQKEAWIYKGDIVGFFMNIRKDIMWRMLRDLINAKYTGDDKELLLFVVRKTVFHHPEKHCKIQSSLRY